LVVACPSFDSGRLSSLGCHFGPKGSSGRIVHGRQLVLRQEKHPILRYVHAGFFAGCWSSLAHRLVGSDRSEISSNKGDITSIHRDAAL
jgi:hypothetical protein